VIGVPFEDNDLTCLGKISEIVAQVVDERPDWLVELATRFADTEELAAWIRSLPQRDDEGTPRDGPKVIACAPWQRLRLPAEDPNCVERSALYLAVAELIEPWPVRRLSTLDFSWGRHTFPIEEGEPLVLNPRVTEEDLLPAVPVRKRRIRHGPVFAPEPVLVAPALPPTASAPADTSSASSADAPVAPAPAAPTQATPTQATPTQADTRSANSARIPVAIDINEAIEYTSQLAEAGAQAVRNGPSRAGLARNAIRDLVEHGKPPADRDTVNAMGWFLATAERVAHGYGLRALTIVRTTAHAVADLVDDVLAARQRNLSFEIGGTSFELPSWLSSAGSLAGKIGLNLGAAYVAPKLAALGVTGQMVDLVEQELNAEGLTLGPIAKPTKSFTSALNSLSRRAV
jgi:hypothetical protein